MGSSGHGEPQPTSCLTDAATVSLPSSHRVPPAGPQLEGGGQMVPRGRNLLLPQDSSAALAALSWPGCGGRGPRATPQAGAGEGGCRCQGARHPQARPGGMSAPLSRAVYCLQPPGFCPQYHC